MSDDENFNSNLTRDLYAISTFGTLEGMLEDIRQLRNSQLRQQQHQTPSVGRPRLRRPSPIVSKGHQVIIMPDDEMPRSMGRGAAMDALGGTMSDYPAYFTLTQELQEIGSGTLRNETIEAFYEQECSMKKLEDCSLLDSDEDVKSSTAVQASAQSVSTAEVQLPNRLSPNSTLSPDKQSPSTLQPKRTRKPRNVILRNYQANVSKEEPQLADDQGPVADPVPVYSEATPSSLLDDDISSEVFVIQGNIDFTFGDSTNNSEIDVESQESYMLDDEPLSCELQKSIEASDVSSCSTSNSTHSASPRRGYHGTSNRNRMIVKSPLTIPRNSAAEKRSPSNQNEIYSPEFVKTSFTYKKGDFPAL